MAATLVISGDPPKHTQHTYTSPDSSPICTQAHETILEGHVVTRLSLKKKEYPSPDQMDSTLAVQSIIYSSIHTVGLRRLKDADVHQETLVGGSREEGWTGPLRTKN